MRALYEFVRLSREKRVLLMKALWLVISVRFALWFLPFRVVRNAIEKFAQTSVKFLDREADSVESVVWAVTVASRRVPAASCLTQALATQVLLRRRSYPAELRIGVAPGERGEIAAHAWIELDGRIIIGGSDSARRFVTLLTGTGGDDPAAQGKERMR